MANVIELDGVMRVRARDATGQHRYTVSARRGDSVGAVVRGLAARLGLGPQAREHEVVHAFRARDGRHLHPSERVGDVLREGEEVRLRPDVQAG